MQSVKIDVKSRDKKTLVHLMPCEIEYNGPVAVSGMFQPGISIKKDSDILEASFRGKPLCGKTLNLPSKCNGLLLQKNKLDDQSDFFVKEKFSSITYWNWDQVPSANDGLPKALQWMQASEKLHQLLTLDQVKKMLE